MGFNRFLIYWIKINLRLNRLNDKKKTADIKYLVMHKLRNPKTECLPPTLLRKICVAGLVSLVKERNKGHFRPNPTVLQISQEPNSQLRGKVSKPTWNRLPILHRNGFFWYQFYPCSKIRFKTMHKRTPFTYFASHHHLLCRVSISSYLFPIKPSSSFIHFNLLFVPSFVPKL